MAETDTVSLIYVIDNLWHAFQKHFQTDFLDLLNNNSETENVLLFCLHSEGDTCMAFSLTKEVQRITMHKMYGYI